MARNQIIDDKKFGILKLEVAGWFDSRKKCIDMKLLFKDHIKNVSLLDNCIKTIDFFKELINGGYLSKKDVTILYDTISVSEQSGIEQQLRDKLPSLHIPNLKNRVITRFSHHRQRLVKLGMVLSKQDTDNISQLRDLGSYEDSWSLIRDLEKKRVIHETQGQMKDFIDDLKYLELHDAVDALTEGAYLPLTLANQNSTEVEGQQSPRMAVGQPSSNINVVIRVEHYLINEHDGPDTKLKIDNKQIGVSEFENFMNYLRSIGIQLEVTENKCLVFHLFTYNPNALRKLWKMHQSGKLLKDIAEIFVEKENSQDFTKRWKTWIDETEYEAALCKLARKKVDLINLIPFGKSRSMSLPKLSYRHIDSVDLINLIPFGESRSMSLPTLSYRHIDSEGIEVLASAETSEMLKESDEDQGVKDSQVTNADEKLVFETSQGTELLSREVYEKQDVECSQGTTKKVDENIDSEILQGTKKLVKEVEEKQVDENIDFEKFKGSKELLIERDVKQDVEILQTSSKIVDEDKGAGISILKKELSREGDLKYHVLEMLHRKGLIKGITRYKELQKEMKSEPKVIKSRLDESWTMTRDTELELKKMEVARRLKIIGSNIQQRFHCKRELQLMEPSIESQQSITQEQLPVTVEDIDDISNSLRRFCCQALCRREITDNDVIEFMKNRQCRSMSLTEMKFKDIGKVFAHALIVAEDEADMLCYISEVCTDNDVVRILSAECKRLRFRYTLKELHGYSIHPLGPSLLNHLLSNAPMMQRLWLPYGVLTGNTVNDAVDKLPRQVRLELTYLYIQYNNFSDIKSSTLATLLAIAPKLKYLNMNSCKLSGAIIDDMINECTKKRFALQLNHLDIGNNNLKNVKGSTLVTLLGIAPKLEYLNMLACNLSGAIVDDMVNECTMKGVVLQLVDLNVSYNNLNNIKGSSLGTLLAIAHKLKYLDISDCNVSGVVMDDMINYCTTIEVVLELVDLDVSYNDLNNIKGSSLVSLLAVAPKLKKLTMQACNLPDNTLKEVEKSMGLVISQN